MHRSVTRNYSRRVLIPVCAVLTLLGGIDAPAATFGTVVATGGHISDIALDERRGLLYMANLGGNRIDAMSTADNKLREPLGTFYEPSAIALSPDGRYLAVAHLASGDYTTSQSRVTIVDLETNARKLLAIIPGNSLALAFGNSPKALLVTTGGLYMVDPVSGEVVRRPDSAAGNAAWPCVFGTYPPNMIQAAAAVSGDGNVIRVLATRGGTASGSSPSLPTTPDAGQGACKPGNDDVSLLLRYDVAGDDLSSMAITATPTLGPRLISTDRTGDTLLAGWGLLGFRQTAAYLIAQFPRATGEYSRGGHAVDYSRNLIFGDIPDKPFTPVSDGFGPASGFDEAFLHVFAPDNLTVIERLRLPEHLGGKTLFNRSVSRLYAISQSGVTVFPMDTYQQLPRVQAQKEDVVLKGNGCDRTVLTGDFDIIDPSGRQVDFSLKLPEKVRGVRLSAISGTTPARIQIEVDPVAFQERKGTTAIPVEITSARGVNMPAPVRLLINTRDPEQRGAILNVPGSIVDMLADPRRDRAYLLRQDRNEVLVYDTVQEKVTGRLRTGNTPVGMSISAGRDQLYVGNDNSGLVNVYDLNTLQQLRPIIAPLGYYPRTVAALNGTAWATARTSSGKPEGVLLRLDTTGSVGVVPERLGVYKNELKKDSVVAASPQGNVMFMAQPDGTVVRYEAAYDGFSAARVDYASLSGGYAAVSDDLFSLGTQVLNRSLVPMRRIDGDGASSGFAGDGAGTGYFVYSKLATAPGVIAKIDITGSRVFAPTYTAEAASTSESLKYTPVGQIGQTILPFTRTVASLPDGSMLVQSISGLTKLPMNFDEFIPAPVLSGIRNLADGSEAVAPGGLVRIQGDHLTDHAESAAVLPLPTSLGEVCATVNNQPLPMLSIGRGELRAQLPQDVSGKTSLVIRTAGGTATLAFNVMPSAPAVFRTGTAGDASGLPLVYRAANGELVTGTNPVRVNDTLLVYGTGLGRTSPGVPDGYPAADEPLARATTMPAVTLGGVPLRVDYAGLIPGMVGIAQFNLSVPATVPEGMQVPLNIKTASYESTIDVRVVKP